MKKLAIDLDELVFQATWNHAECAPLCVLDTHTGQLIIIEGELCAALEDGEDPIDWDPEEIEQAREVLRDPSRYESLPELESQESFGFMEDFVREKAQGKAREALIEALERGKPFRRFKNALTEFPSVREEWFAYEAKRQRAWMRRWLASLGLESTL